MNHATNGPNYRLATPEVHMPAEPLIFRVPPEGVCWIGPPLKEPVRILAPGRYPHQYAVQPMGRKWGRR